MVQMSYAATVDAPFAAYGAVVNHASAIADGIGHEVRKKPVSVYVGIVSGTSSADEKMDPEFEYAMVADEVVANATNEKWQVESVSMV